MLGQQCDPHNRMASSSIGLLHDISSGVPLSRACDIKPGRHVRVAMAPATRLDETTCEAGARRVRRTPCRRTRGADARHRRHVPRRPL